MALQPISDKEYPRNLGNTFPFACFFFKFCSNKCNIWHSNELQLRNKGACILNLRRSTRDITLSTYTRRRPERVCAYNVNVHHRCRLYTSSIDNICNNYKFAVRMLLDGYRLWVLCCHMYMKFKKTSLGWVIEFLPNNDLTM